MRLLVGSRLDFSILCWDWDEEADANMKCEEIGDIADDGDGDDVDGDEWSGPEDDEEADHLAADACGEVVSMSVSDAVGFDGGARQSRIGVASRKGDGGRRVRFTCDMLQRPGEGNEWQCRTCGEQTIGMSWCRRRGHSRM